MRTEHGTAHRRNVLKEVWMYRFALQNLILKDFRIRYRNMSLGILWSVLNPLVMLGVLVVVFSYIHPQHNEHCFPIFLLLGLIPFNFFSLCVSTSTNCVVENAPLVKKVIFPRHILPIAVVLSQTIHLVIQLFLLAVFILIFRVPVHSSYLWLVPVYAVELIFILGTTLTCAAVNVYYRDALYLIQSGLTVMFWFTPIFYSLTIVKMNLPASLYWVYILNPLAGIIDTSRRAVLDHAGPGPSFAVAAAVAAFMLVLGFTVFNRKEKNFADKV